MKAVTKLRIRKKEMLWLNKAITEKKKKIEALSKDNEEKNKEVNVAPSCWKSPPKCINNLFLKKTKCHTHLVTDNRLLANPFELHNVENRLVSKFAAL